MKRLDNGNIEFVLSVPWSKIVSEYNHLVDHAVGEAELPGFRKGKAPRKDVEARLNKNEVYGKAVEKLLPEIYARQIKELSLKPILQPRIKLDKSGLDQDWEFTVVTCEAPKIDLPNKYLTSLIKTDKDKRFDWLDKEIMAVIPELLAEEEANHRLTVLIENFTKLGLTTEQYLASKKMTAETLKAESIAQARRDLKMEFALEAIRVDNKLTDRKATLDFLTNLV